MNRYLTTGIAATAVGIGVGAWSKIDGDASDRKLRDDYAPQAAKANAFIDDASKALGFDVSRPDKTFAQGKALATYLKDHRPPRGVDVEPVGLYEDGMSFSAPLVRASPLEQHGANGWMSATLVGGTAGLGVAAMKGGSNLLEGILHFDSGGGEYASGRVIGTAAVAGAGLLAGTGIGWGIGKLVGMAHDQK